MPITYTSGEQIEVYRFSIPVTVGVPLLALFLQAFLPRRFPFFSIFDLPLLVTIFFAMARRNPISGLLHRRGDWAGSGHAGGLSDWNLRNRQDGGRVWRVLAGSEAGRGECRRPVSGDAGFLPGAPGVYFTVARGMVSMTLNWSWGRGILAGLANAVLGVGLYFVLDKFKQRT